MAMVAGSVAAGGAGTGLAKEMYDDLITKFDLSGAGTGLITAQGQVADLCNSIAQTVVAHIQANAEVATSVTVTSVTGVTAGAATSGPGTGSGAGTVA